MVIGKAALILRQITAVNLKEYELEEVNIFNKAPIARAQN